jgi:hypothetical protein
MFSISLAVAAQASPHEPHGQHELSGTAVSTSDGRVLYTEFHRWQGDWHLAEYRAPDGTLLATNELDYSPGAAQPAFVQTNKQTGVTQGARWRGDELTLFNGDRSETVDYRKPLVISSGFNNYVLAHWDDLQRAEHVVDFAVTERLLVVRLQIRRITQAETEILDPQPGWVYFRVEAANTVLGWFVPAVDLAYSAERQLRVYRGTSNVEIAGETPAVEIRY